MNTKNMKIGILGTGMVGRSLAGKLTELGHDVVIGTRDVASTLAESKPIAKDVSISSCLA